MHGLGEGLAFSALVAGAVYLEVNNYPAGGLWAVIIIWIVLTDWGQKND